MLFARGHAPKLRPRQRQVNRREDEVLGLSRRLFTKEFKLAVAQRVNVLFHKSALTLRDIKHRHDSRFDVYSRCLGW